MYLEYGARLKHQGYTIKCLPTTYFIHHNKETFRSDHSKNILKEAQLFAMFCLSFFYQSTFKNRIETLGQLLLDLILREYSISTVKSAYKNYEAFVKCHFK